VTNWLGAPRLRIVYRSHGGENLKSRPSFYSKLLALASFVRAAQESGVDPHLLFWNDGPMPADRLELMRATGEVVRIDVGSNRASYRAAIEMVAQSDWSSRDVIWFAEDDYLYRPRALRAVMAAAAAIPDADYLSVFGGAALDVDSPLNDVRAYPRSGAADVPQPIDAGGFRWFRGVSTTSTFGVRLSVLREDRHLLRILPYSGGSWDHTTCLAVQGRQPFTWAEVREELMPFGEQPVGRWPASVARGIVRAGVNLRSHRAPERRRTLYLCDPVGAVHLELPDDDDFPDAHDPRHSREWSDLAAQTRRWAADRGITVREPDRSR
jgi:hypothetical protein